MNCLSCSAEPQFTQVKGKDGRVYKGLGIANENGSPGRDGKSRSPSGDNDKSKKLLNLRWDKYGLNKSAKRRKVDHAQETVPYMAS